MVRIVWDLGWADFQLKYRGSVLGYFWSFAVPFCKFVIFFYVFRVLFVVDIPFYSLYLFLGIILWEYFANVTMACIGIPLTYADIIKNVAFPRFLLVFTVGWIQTIIFCTHVAIFFVMSVMMGAAPSWNALYFPVPFLQFTLFSLGIGSLLASYALRFRDFPHLWGILLQVFFWLTPITYVHAVHAPATVEFLQMISSPQQIIGWEMLTFFTRFQPLSLIIFDTRRVLLPDGGGMPSLVHSVVLTAICLLVFWIGLLVFRKRSRSFVQEY